MNREDALTTAYDLVEKMGASPDLNARGYKHDGWKPMTGPERTEAIIKLATFLLDEPTPPVRDIPAPVSTIFGWPIDGRGGLPSKAQYRTAQEVLIKIRTDGGLYRVEEYNALQALVDAYEEALQQPGPPPLVMPPPPPPPVAV